MSPRSKEASGMMREKTREAILATSLELFAKHGYSATTTERIAAKARISKGLIFDHFRTKQDILFTILDEEIELVMPQFFSDDDARPAGERFASLIDAWLKMIKEQTLYLRLSLQLSLDDEYRKLMKKKGKQYFDAMFSRLTRLMRELGSDSPQLDCFLLMLAFDGIVANYTVAPELFPIDAIKDHLIATLTSRWKTSGLRRRAVKSRHRPGLTLK